MTISRRGPQRGPGSPSRSKYAKHDDYILRHYISKGPSAIGRELGMPPNAVIGRYDIITGKREARNKAKRETGPAVFIPKVSLDR